MNKDNETILQLLERTIQALTDDIWKDDECKPIFTVTNLVDQYRILNRDNKIETILTIKHNGYNLSTIINLDTNYKQCMLSLYDRTM